MVTWKGDSLTIGFTGQISWKSPVGHARSEPWQKSETSRHQFSEWLCFKWVLNPSQKCFRCVSLSPYFSGKMKLSPRSTGFGGPGKNTNKKHLCICVRCGEVRRIGAGMVLILQVSHVLLIDHWSVSAIRAHPFDIESQ